MNIGKWSDWLLRMESDNFIMVVNRETNEYRNIYAKDLKNKKQIKIMVLLLEKHHKYEN